MRTAWLTLKILFWLVILGVPALFVLQNHLRTTELSLDLGFVAWKLSEPVSVPFLLLGTLLLGLLAGWLFGTFRRGGRDRDTAFGGESAGSGSGPGDSW
jgi:hypothetical protein